MKLVFFSSALWLLLATVSCQNKKAVNYEQLTKLSPTSKAYKQQLAQALSTGSDEVVCTFENYSKVNENSAITINIKAPDFTAKETLLIDDCERLSFMKINQGLGYRGAQLKGMKLNVVEGLSGAMLKLNSLKEIID